MYLIELFLLLYANNGEAFSKDAYLSIGKDMTKKFGGMTAFTRAPAKGFWQKSKEELVKDDIIIFEVMTKKLDKEWWSNYKILLEKTFSQDDIIIRVQQIELIDAKS
jgi:hypothetical protein